MKDAKILLEFLTESFPPGENQHHSIVIENGRLTLYLMLGDKYLPLIFDECDLGKPIEQQCNELRELVAAEIEIRGKENDQSITKLEL